MTEQPTQRKTFTEETDERTRQFISELTAAVPEIEAVGVTFSYRARLDGAPAGLIMHSEGRAIGQPGELVRMLQQLSKMVDTVAGLTTQYVQNVDTYMGEQARQLQELQRQIQRTQEQLPDEQSATPGVPGQY